MCFVGFCPKSYAELVDMQTVAQTPSPANGVPDHQQKNLDWYIANQADLSSKYNGKILLIVDQKLIGAFDTMGDANVTAMKSYELGSFTLQPCSPDAGSYTLMLYSPAYSAMA